MFYCLMLRSISLYAIAVFILLILMISSSLSVSIGQTTEGSSSSSSTRSFLDKWCIHAYTKIRNRATSLGDTIYVFGGFDTSGQPTDIVESYSVKDSTWQPGSPLPHVLHYICAVYLLMVKYMWLVDTLIVNGHLATGCSFINPSHKSMARR